MYILCFSPERITRTTQNIMHFMNDYHHLNYTYKHTNTGLTVCTAVRIYLRKFANMYGIGNPYMTILRILGFLKIRTWDF